MNNASRSAIVGILGGIIAMSVPSHATLVGDTGNIYHRRVYYYRPVVYVRKHHVVYHRKRHTVRHKSRPVTLTDDDYVYHSSVSASSSRMTDEKRIQKALQGLGYYHGAINGRLNTYNVRMSIKQANEHFGYDPVPILNQRMRENLTVLGMLFFYDENLISGQGSRTRQVQTALTILGYYTGALDGIRGQATREAIRSYKQAKGAFGTQLSYDETYQLVKQAKEKLDGEISDLLRAMRREPPASPTEQPVRVPAAAPVPAPEPAAVPPESEALPVPPAQPMSASPAPAAAESNGTPVPAVPQPAGEPKPQ